MKRRISAKQQDQLWRHVSPPQPEAPKTMGALPPPLILNNHERAHMRRENEQSRLREIARAALAEEAMQVDLFLPGAPSPSSDRSAPGSSDGLAVSSSARQDATEVNYSVLDAFWQAVNGARRTRSPIERETLLADAHNHLDQLADPNSVCGDCFWTLDPETGLCENCIEAHHQIALARESAGKTAAAIDPLCGF